MNRSIVSRSAHVLVLLAVFALARSGDAHAGDVDMTFPFKLDEWNKVEVTDGPITIHRIMIERQTGITKSSFFRPGNTEFLETVRIVIDYSNQAKRDWKARLDLAWLDEKGRVIDGYLDSENLDSDEYHDTDTVTLSTLKYGIDVAKDFRVRIKVLPD
ncbi:MAG: hypothetical protein HYV63_25620 [Candidatus Schekmanbacteria bacterium]|nr:hypothetical protein [Candidatus Schekmanbacteria bacterium]